MTIFPSHCPTGKLIEFSVQMATNTWQLEWDEGLAIFSLDISGVSNFIFKLWRLVPADGPPGNEHHIRFVHVPDRIGKEVADEGPLRPQAKWSSCGTKISSVVRRAKKNKCPQKSSLKQ